MYKDECISILILLKRKLENITQILDRPNPTCSS